MQSSLRFSVLFFYTLFRSAISQGYDDDLMSFVTQPNLRPPILNVSLHDRARTKPGYWFVAPYGDLLQRDTGKLAVPDQTGPHIYRDDGTLVWSGADLFPTRTICDFRLMSIDGVPTLSFIVVGRSGALEYPQGVGLIMDNTYSLVDEIANPMEKSHFNMHELLLQDSGKTALVLFDTAVHYSNSSEHSWAFVDSGFTEIDVRSGEQKFIWFAAEHIAINASTKPPPPQGSYAVYDWLHLNSIDRDSSGNFMISARYTDAIYLISQQNGSILWELGGVNSSFQLQGFNFSRQHDARFIEQTESTTIISILDNASDAEKTTRNTSAALLVFLDHNTKIASLLKQWDRPDGELSYLRGNAQILPDSNVFVGWSASDGYMSEHSWDGDVLMEARFVSDRLSTYRAYKFFDFWAIPTKPPVARALVYPTDTGDVLTIFYASWNGATEVASWNFYATENGEEETWILAGQKLKSGFETSYAYTGYTRYVIAEAVAANGTSLRNSTMQLATPPQHLCTPEIRRSELQCLLEIETTLRSSASQISHDYSILSFLNQSFSRPGSEIWRSLALIIFGYCLCMYRKQLSRGVGNRWRAQAVAKLHR